MLIHSTDEHCRYLPAPECNPGLGFGGFVKEMGVTLPYELHDMIRFGWIRPVLRVRIPTEFYLAWENYPAYGLQGNIADADLWAAQLRERCAFLGARWYGDRDPAGTWYYNFLDDQASELGRQAWANSIPVGSEADDPIPVAHPRRNELVRPWIDYFSYWQVYELIEVLDHLQVCGPILDTPEVELVLETLRQSLSWRRQDSLLRIQATRQRWERNARVFDWISRYRTLLAISSRMPITPVKVDEGAARLMRDRGLSPEQLRQDIRDVLLEEWQRLQHRLPAPAREHFREDIMRAVQFYEAVTGKEADLADPYWAPRDRMNHGFTPLPEVLPFEALSAKWSFPEQAMVYLEGRAQVIGPISEDRLEALAERWWHPSVQFRRFCMAFKRLHDDYSVSSEDKLGFRARTPIEFLILSCLNAEKMLQMRYRHRRPGANLPRSARTLVGEMYGEVLRARGVLKPSVNAARLVELLRQNDRDQLHGLSQNPQNPFIVTQEITWGDALTSALAIAFGNLVILRNYAAHHDVLDDMLLGDPKYALPAIDAVLIPTVLVLEIP
jgi:hypothetical protein